MPTRTAKARWEGTLDEGNGTLQLPSQDYEGPFSKGSRFADAAGTNPEELVGAAHAGCFSMFLSALLSDAGYEPNSIETTADVTIETTDAGPTITRIDLRTEADVPGLDEDEFRQNIEAAKNDCPVSKALAGVGEVTVEASLR